MRLVSDLALAVITIFQEARGESFQGKIAVAEVIRNRMRMKYSSDGTVVGTVLRPYQFSGWNTQDPNRIPAMRIDDTDPVVQECVQAWHQSENSSFVGQAVLYLNKSIVHPLPNWARDDKEVARIGAHTFYIA